MFTSSTFGNAVYKRDWDFLLVEKDRYYRLSLAECRDLIRARVTLERFLLQVGKFFAVNVSAFSSGSSGLRLGMTKCCHRACPVFLFPIARVAEANVLCNKISRC
jgi:hypothetical protein